MITKRTCGLPLICLICGDIARGINFNVMTCMSCKTFFRRHALIRRIQLECQHANNCEITKQTRGNCSACRLRKCFSFGMIQKSVRRRFPNNSQSHHDERVLVIKDNQYPLPKPLPINLVRTDLSDLTTDEWTLLSNIIHTYDSTGTISQMKYFFDQQSSLPPKIRLKPSKAINIFKYFLSTLHPFIERTPFFQSLSTRTRRVLIENNSEIAGTLNAIYIIREINALENTTFLSSCTAVYGQKVITYTANLVDRLETNETLIKMMVLILIFSTNCSIVNVSYVKNLSAFSMASTIFNIQNIFVTMFWKYLNYQYGYVGAIRCFSGLIKYMVDILHYAHEMRCIQHEQMVETIVEETKRVLADDN